MFVYARKFAVCGLYKRIIIFRVPNNATTFTGSVFPLFQSRLAELIIDDCLNDLLFNGRGEEADEFRFLFLAIEEIRCSL